MDPHWGLSCLSLLCLLTLAPGQRDFDLADALDDPEPTKKPSSDGHPRPKPPYPQPESPGHGGGIYPRLKPQPRPQPENNNHGGHWNNEDEGYHPPRPKPPAGGQGYRPKPRYGNGYGGGETSTYNSPQGNTIARIVSPIVSVVVVALLGASVSFFKSNRRANCLRAGDAVDV